MKITFEQQAQKFLNDGATRKRKPLRPSSLRAYKSDIAHLLPLIGKMPLQTVGSNVLRDVVTKLSEKGLSPRTISRILVVAKKIRRSATNENGDQLFPVSFSSDVIDAPSIEDSKRPMVTAAEVTGAISKALVDGRANDAALYTILAGTGLRIAEARAIKIGSDDGISSVWIPQENKVIVRQQMVREGLAPTKTKAGQREADLTPELGDWLKGIFSKELEKLSAETRGLMFEDCENCYRDHLIKDGIIGGFHAFRRFRITHLEAMSVPSGLAMFWTGHGAKNIHESYLKFGANIEARKTWCQRAKIGFDLPEIK